MQDTGAACKADPAGGFVYGGLEGWSPQWMTLESDTWRKRMQVLRRFVNAARTVVYRLRADKRLKALRSIMGGWRALGLGAWHMHAATDGHCRHHCKHDTHAQQAATCAP